jgi:hypothetical protein
MLQTMEYAAALAYLETERVFFRSLSQDTHSKKSGEAGLAFLNYFQSTWLSPDLWKSWSRKGRLKAAALLNVDIEGVLPTTNHLEPFNGVLKRKHITQWQRAGRQLRFDVLIYRLIVKILPSIYARQRMISQFHCWKSERFSHTMGDVILVSTSRSPKKKPQPTPPLAWYEPDPKRDSMAQDIFKLARIVPIENHRMYELWATCASTEANMSELDYPRYWMTVHPSGTGTCTCMDWLIRGGACKHLRAFRLVLDMWRQEDKLLHVYHFPTSRDEAIQIEYTNRQWYGPSYDLAITIPIPTNLEPDLVQAPKTWQTGSKNYIPLPPPPTTTTDTTSISLEQEAELEHDMNQLHQIGVQANDIHGHQVEVRV